VTGLAPHRHVHDVAAGWAGMRTGVIHRTGWTMLSGCPIAAEHTPRRAYGVDLRSPGEAAADPVECLPPETLLLPVDVAGVAARLTGTPSAAEYTALNLDTLHGCGDAIAGLVTVVLARLPRPVVLGCSLGKDRTGLVVALLLTLAGADDDEICAQDRLARSSILACPTAVDRYAARRGVSTEELARRCAVDDSPLRTALHTLRTDYGGAAAYLEVHGAPAGLLGLARVALRR